MYAVCGEMAAREYPTVALQAFFSGTAKMCVRELRSTEAPNVVVFYLALISSLGALTGTIVQVRTAATCARDQVLGACRVLHQGRADV